MVVPSLDIQKKAAVHAAPRPENNQVEEELPVQSQLVVAVAPVVPSECDCLKLGRLPAAGRCFLVRAGEKVGKADGIEQNTAL